MGLLSAVRSLTGRKWDVKDTLKARSGIVLPVPFLGHERQKAECFVLGFLRSAEQAAVCQQQQRLNAVT